ncbi:MAG: hypothetical protein ABI591_19175 [Kofleriaceae bacterium]
MKYLAIVLVISCTNAHPAATDRLDCVSCHQAEYASAQMGMFAVSSCTKKPVHDPALGYTTNCYTCHGTATPDPDPDPAIQLSGWCPAVDPVSDPVQHGVFRIATGSHVGFDCGDCHTQRIAGQSLTSAIAPNPIECTSCHWHDQAQTDPRHTGNSNYTYGPATCVASECHGGGLRQ